MPASQHTAGRARGPWLIVALGAILVAAACSASRGAEHDDAGLPEVDAAPDVPTVMTAQFSSFTVGWYSSFACTICSGGSTIDRSGAVTSWNTTGDLCSGMAAGADFDSFAALASSNAVIAGFAAGTDCQGSIDGGETLSLQLVDGRSFGLHNATTCTPGTPLAMVKDAASALVAKYCTVTSGADGSALGG
jgi:hypothetical protein